MKKNIVLCVFFMFLYNSCKKEQKVTVVNSFDFNTKIIDVHFRFVGLYEQDGTEYLYFLDEEKDIKIFDFDGKLFDSIPLKNLIYDFATKRDKIHGGVQFAGKDSIFINSNYRNNIGLINHKGEVLQTVCIDDILPDTVKERNRYSISVLPNSIDIYGNSVMFYAHCDGIIARTKDCNPPAIEYYEKYFKIFYETPYLLEIKNIFKNAGYKFLAQYYYKKLNNKFFAINSGGYFKLINKNIFILCAEKPLIFKYSGANYDVLKILKIKSDFTELTENIAEVKIACDFIENPQNREKYELMNKLRACIHNIFYNSKEQKYYVLIGHALKNIEEFEKYKYDYRPFSVIIYDKNFENPKEYAFPADIYKYRNTIMTSKGLLIQRKEQNLTPENYGTQTFDLLRFY
jgi:hypothetical protein